jgi:hypothetical protein
MQINESKYDIVYVYIYVFHGIQIFLLRRKYTLKFNFEQSENYS